MAAPCARLRLVRGPVRNTDRGRPFNGIVRHHQMPWHIRELREFERRHRGKRRTSAQPSPHYLRPGTWLTVEKHHLKSAILYFAAQESIAPDHARSKFRGKRLRAVEIYRRRFGDLPLVRDYAKRELPEVW